MFTVKIETKNAAFADGNKAAETARLLRSIAEHLEQNAAVAGHCYDVNGNQVGHFQFHGKD